MFLSSFAVESHTLQLLFFSFVFTDTELWYQILPGLSESSITYNCTKLCELAVKCKM